MTRRLGNRPGLTGLRGIAIAIVVARHAGELTYPAITAFAFGFAGVDIFFVLSGFLITSLLVGEWSRTGRISLPQFYVRRALRLLPALVVFLLAVLITIPWQPDAAQRPLLKTVAWSAAFLGNIARLVDPSFAFAHMWSLGMEEQFYLVWPTVLLLLLALRLRRRTVIGVAVTGAALVCVTRIVLDATGAASPLTLFYSPLHSDGLLIGSALGLTYTWGLLPEPETVRRWLVPAVLVAAAVFGVVSACGAPYVSWGMTVGLAVIALAAAVLVYAAVDRRPVWPLRFLTWRPVTYLGEISYALYLWHFAVLWLWPTNQLRVEGRVGVSVVLAAASYHLVEKPFLRRKPRHTPDRAESDAALGPIVVEQPQSAV